MIIGRLEDFATQIDTGLEEADWLRKREMIRALVKRVEVTQEQVNVVFRVDSYQEESDPEKKRLQLCRGSNMSLHEGNIARYRLRPSQYQAWRETWR